MKIIVGVDISKASFDGAYEYNGRFRVKHFSNDAKGFLAFDDWLSGFSRDDIHVCLEATGIYGVALASHCVAVEKRVSMVNPAQVKSFSNAQLSRNKTDKSDAKVIAKFCEAMSPRDWKPLSAPIQHLRALVSRLTDLKQMIRQEKNRLESANIVSQPYLESSIDFILQQMASLKEAIKTHVEDCPSLHSDYKLLETIPGIGSETIYQILAYLDWSAFESAREMAAYVGVTPMQRQSGTSVNGRTKMSKIGHAHLRKALYLPAVVAKKHNPIVNAFCHNLLESGKPKMVVIGAAMRKLIHIIYGVLKSGQPFNAALATSNSSL